jgi:hypothetical protein
VCAREVILTAILYSQVFDGIIAETINRREGRNFRGVCYREIAPPDTKQKPWVKEWDDLGLDIIDFSFWTHGDLQILIEPRDNQ